MPVSLLRVDVAARGALGLRRGAARPLATARCGAAPRAAAASTQRLHRLQVRCRGAATHVRAPRACQPKVAARGGRGGLCGAPR